MEMIILSFKDALRFIPKKRTYAIRIFSTNQEQKDSLKSHNYSHIAEYIFDEESREAMERDTAKFGEPFFPVTLFTEKIAESMIEEYLPFKEQTESMLIHCFAGACRSRSIRKAFNDIFEFDNEKSLFLDSIGKFPCHHLYETLLNVAERNKIGIFR